MDRCNGQNVLCVGNVYQTIADCFARASICGKKCRGGGGGLGGKRRKVAAGSASLLGSGGGGGGGGGVASALAGVGAEPRETSTFLTKNSLNERRKKGRKAQNS